MDLKHIAAAESKAVQGGEKDDPIAALGMYFEVDKAGRDMRVTEELIPNGSSVLVTKANIHSYIHKYAHYKLNVETRQQTRAFLSGFRQLIPLDWLRIFSTQGKHRFFSLPICLSVYLSVSLSGLFGLYK